MNTYLFTGEKLSVEFLSVAKARSIEKTETATITMIMDVGSNRLHITQVDGAPEIRAA